MYEREYHGLTVGSTLSRSNPFPVSPRCAIGRQWPPGHAAWRRADDLLAVCKILRQQFPELKIRVINVVDLMTLQPQSEHPHGLSDKDFDTLFTKDKPIIFAFHGYPWLIHRLAYRRTNHKNLHVRGYKENGTTTTPFDMVVLNDLDRFHLVGDVIDRVPSLGSRAAYAKQFIRDKLYEHTQYIDQHGEDLPEIRNWKWELTHE
jgi:xylulose-5-phosphate/fructose-6-phosphate phosphoketolase